MKQAKAQYSIAPRVLANEDGWPHKSNKSH